jgi:hypothetical protein
MTMKLRAYALNTTPPPIVAAARTREWMDAFTSRHPYRCLPLSMANGYGWEVLCPHTFTIHWNGGDAAADVRFEAEGDAPYLHYFVNSNFTRGIVTFHTAYLFQTDPQWHLMATGPLNAPKDGIAPLTGVIETDWLPYPFTMNWRLTRPGSVRFEAGEPFCRIFPVRVGDLQGAELDIFDLGDAPDLDAQYTAWRQQRDEFMTRYRAGDSATLKQAWQKFYFRGTYPDGVPAAAPHSSKLELGEPNDRRRKR